MTTTPIAAGPNDVTVMQHTPGPWGLIIGDAGPIIFSGNKGNMVATCIRQITSAEREANARLISAAPDLLESLRYAVAQVPELATVPGIAAAMAKVTGRDA